MPVSRERPVHVPLDHAADRLIDRAHEVQRYEYEITPSGNITYNALSGYHDDCVIALALANSERYQFKWSGAIHVLPSAPNSVT